MGLLMSKDVYDKDSDKDTIMERYPIFVHHFRKLNYLFLKELQEHPHVVNDSQQPRVIYKSVLQYGISV